MLIKTMKQYANEAWESRLVLSSFVSSAEVSQRQDVFWRFSENSTKLLKIEQQKRALAVLNTHLQVAKRGIAIHHEYVTNALFRYRYFTMNEGREVGEISVVKLM